MDIVTPIFELHVDPSITALAIFAGAGIAIIRNFTHYLIATK